MSAAQIATLAVLMLLLFWCVGAYKRLVGLRNDIQAAFVHMQTQIKRRHELIPAMVQAARPSLPQERETMERVLAACKQSEAACDLVRARPVQAGPVKSLGLAEVVLSAAMAGFELVLASQEALAIDEDWQRLRDELAETDRRVSFARQTFNDATQAYNHAVRQLPASVLAKLLGFGVAPLLPAGAQASDGEAASLDTA